jgi:hypothetical protein
VRSAASGHHLYGAKRALLRTQGRRVACKNDRFAVSSFCTEMARPIKSLSCRSPAQDLVARVSSPARLSPRMNSALVRIGLIPSSVGLTPSATLMAAARARYYYSAKARAKRTTQARDVFLLAATIVTRTAETLSLSGSARERSGLRAERDRAARAAAIASRGVGPLGKAALPPQGRRPTRALKIGEDLNRPF